MKTPTHPLFSLRAATLAAALAFAGLPAAAVGPAWQQLSFGADFSDVDQDGYQISSDSQWVVFAHDPDFENTRQLFSVPLDGSAPPVRISGLLGPGSLGDFAVTPDGSHVTYLARQEDPEAFELFRVPIGGGPAIKLNGALGPDLNVVSFRLSADGSRVAYVVGEVFWAGESLHSVPTSGGAATLLATPHEPTNHIFGQYQFTPAGDRVVYTEELITDQVRIFSVPALGGARQDLGEVGDQFVGAESTDFQISPDGQHVTYLWRTPLLDNRLYTVPVAGGTRVNLAGALTGTVYDFAISPDGSRVVHLALGHLAPDAWGLYTTPIAGGPVDLLLDLGEINFLTSYAFSPDGSRIVFQTDYESAAVAEIFSVPASGGSPTKLNPTLPDGADVQDFRISADSRWVVYLADQLFQGVPTLWRTPIEGPASANVSAFFGSPSFSDPRTWDIDPRSDRLIVLSNLFFVDVVRRPWRQFFAGPSNELVDETEFVSDGAAVEFQLAPNGDLVYRADQNVDEKHELFSVTFPPDEIFADGFESGDLSAW